MILAQLVCLIAPIRSAYVKHSLFGSTVLGVLSEM